MPYAQTGTRIANMGDSDLQNGATADSVAAFRAIAAQLRAERARAGIKQTDLAEKSGLGKNTIQRLESGERDIKLSQLFAIAQVLDFDPAEFLNAAQATMRKQSGVGESTSAN